MGPDEGGGQAEPRHYALRAALGMGGVAWDGHELAVRECHGDSGLHRSMVGVRSRRARVEHLGHRAVERGICGTARRHAPLGLCPCPAGSSRLERTASREDHRSGPRWRWHGQGGRSNGCESICEEGCLGFGHSLPWIYWDIGAGQRRGGSDLVGGGLQHLLRRHRW
jgi:hypothetical protein